MKVSSAIITKRIANLNQLFHITNSIHLHLPCNFMHNAVGILTLNPTQNWPSFPIIRASLKHAPMRLIISIFFVNTTLTEDYEISPMILILCLSFLFYQVTTVPLRSIRPTIEHCPLEIPRTTALFFQLCPATPGCWLGLQAGKGIIGKMLLNCGIH